MKRAELVVLMVALVFSGLGAEETGDDAGAKARKDLYRALTARSEQGIKDALTLMIGAGGKQNLEAIVKVLPKIPADDDELYWALIEGACSFVDREALAQLGQSIVASRGTGLARDFLVGLAKNRSPNVVAALAPLLEKGQPDLQLMAVEKIATISSPEAVDALILILKREEQKPESELRDLAVNGLQTITGQDYKTNPVNWEGWWGRNREKPLTGRKPPEVGQTGTVVDQLERRGIRGFEGLEKAPKKSVVVLSAEFPERNLNNSKKHGGSTIQEILQRMGIPHEVVKRPEFDKYDLRGVGALLINCAQFHEFCICPTCKPGGDVQNRLYKCTGCDKHTQFSGKLSAAAIKKIQAFVKRGGFLFCEDWTVKEVVEKAFPKYVSAGTVLKEGAVGVVPARGRASHPYLRGIFSPEFPEEDKPAGGDDGDDDGPKEGTTTVKKTEEEKEAMVGAELVKIKHKWTIDDESWALKLEEAAKVVVLLSTTGAGKTGPVALCFRPGGEMSDAGGAPTRGGPGMVLQVLSHFGRQESVEDEYSLQNLLLNFLIAANVARTAEEMVKKPAKAGGDRGKDQKGAPGAKQDGKDG